MEAGLTAISDFVAAEGEAGLIEFVTTDDALRQACGLAG